MRSWLAAILLLLVVAIIIVGRAVHSRAGSERVLTARDVVLPSRGAYCVDAAGATHAFRGAPPAPCLISVPSGRLELLLERADTRRTVLVTLRQPRGEGLTSLLHSVVTPSSSSVLQFAVTTGAGPVLIQLDNNQDRPVELHRVELGSVFRW